MGKKITVEIDDTLEDRIKNSKQELFNDFKQYLNENQDVDDFDTYYQKRGCETVNEIADSNTPIYNKEIDDLHYLYGDDFEEAYKNAGIGDGGEANYKMVAICIYIEQELFSYMRDRLENELFPEFLENINLFQSYKDDLNSEHDELLEELITIDSFIFSMKPEDTDEEIIHKRTMLIEKIEKVKNSLDTFNVEKKVVELIDSWEIE